jgi:hypothetical protein
MYYVANFLLFTSDICHIKGIVDFSFEINLYDSTKDDLPPNPQGSKPIIYHLFFRSELNNAGVDTYTPNQGWQNIGLTTQPCPVKNGITYNITLESHIRVCRKLSTQLTVPYLLFPQPN